MRWSGVLTETHAEVSLFCSEMILGVTDRQGLEIDLALHLNRSDEDARAFMAGRQLDPVSGLAFHPELRPFKVSAKAAERLQPHPPAEDLEEALATYNAHFPAIRRSSSRAAADVSVADADGDDADDEGVDAGGGQALL
jgi:hypothetical protein